MIFITMRPKIASHFREYALAQISEFLSEHESLSYLSRITSWNKNAQ